MYTDFEVKEELAGEGVSLSWRARIILCQMGQNHIAREKTTHRCSQAVSDISSFVCLDGDQVSCDSGASLSENVHSKSHVYALCTTAEDLCFNPAEKLTASPHSLFSA